MAVLVAAVALATPSVASAGGAHGSAASRASGGPTGQVSAAGRLTLAPANVNGHVGAIVSDASWQLSGIVTLQDGTPLDPLYFAYDGANMRVTNDGAAAATAPQRAPSTASLSSLCASALQFIVCTTVCGSHAALLRRGADR